MHVVCFSACVCVSQCVNECVSVFISELLESRFCSVKRNEKKRKRLVIKLAHSECVCDTFDLLCMYRDGDLVSAHTE